MAASRHKRPHSAAASRHNFGYVVAGGRKMWPLLDAYGRKKSMHGRMWKQLVASSRRKGQQCVAPSGRIWPKFSAWPQMDSHSRSLMPTIAALKAANGLFGPDIYVDGSGHN